MREDAKIVQNISRFYDDVKSLGLSSNLQIHLFRATNEYGERVIVMIDATEEEPSRIVETPFKTGTTPLDHRIIYVSPSAYFDDEPKEDSYAAIS